MLEDPPLQVAKLGTRLQPELVVQVSSRLRVPIECLRLAPRAVERLHQLCLQSFAQCIRVGEGAELRQTLHVSPPLELGGEALLERDEPQLLEPLGLGADELLVGELAVRLPPPERQGAAEDRGRKSGISGLRRLPAILQEALEAIGVEHAVLQLEGVARPVCTDRGLFGQALPELRDIDLEKLRKLVRGGRSPQIAVARTSLGRVLPASASSAARSLRSFGAPRRIGPLSPISSSGPSTRISSRTIAFSRSANTRESAPIPTRNRPSQSSAAIGRNRKEER